MIWFGWNGCCSARVCSVASKDSGARIRDRSASTSVRRRKSALGLQLDAAASLTLDRSYGTLRSLHSHCLVCCRSALGISIGSSRRVDLNRRPSSDLPLRSLRHLSNAARREGPRQGRRGALLLGLCVALLARRKMFEISIRAWRDRFRGMKVLCLFHGNYNE